MRYRMLVWIGALVAPLWLQGCATTPGGGQASLVGTWDVTALDGEPFQGGTAPAVSFDVAGNVAGTTSCNRFRATYFQEGDALRFTQAAATRMMCPSPNAERETAFLERLHAVDRFTLARKKTLTLFTPEGKSITATRR